MSDKKRLRDVTLGRACQFVLVVGVVALMGSCVVYVNIISAAGLFALTSFWPRAILGVLYVCSLAGVVAMSHMFSGDTNE